MPPQGLYVAQNYTKAKHFFEAAAQKGLAAGYNGLGVLHYGGQVTCPIFSSLICCRVSAGYATQLPWWRDLIDTCAHITTHITNLITVQFETSLSRVCSKTTPLRSRLSVGERAWATVRGASYLLAVIALLQPVPSACCLSVEGHRYHTCPHETHICFYTSGITLHLSSSHVANAIVPSRPKRHVGVGYALNHVQIKRI